MELHYSKETLTYWTEQDWQDLKAATTFTQMYAIAARVMERMPRPLVQVCGPIATGGLGSLEANLGAFNEEIKKLQAQGLYVFDQMPFEMPMQEVKKLGNTGPHSQSLLDDFYMPIFKSGNISTAYFMPNWTTSKGATWEHGLMQELGIEIKYL
jgi:hypothetical protein